MEAQDETVNVERTGPEQVEEGQVGGEQIPGEEQEAGGVEETPVSAEEFLRRVAGDLSMTMRRLMMLEQHHQTTINLMKILADRMGLELYQEKVPGTDPGVRVGWRQKVVVAAPGMIKFPPGAGRR